MAIEQTDPQLQTLMHDVLDREHGPHPVWADSPAQRRIANGDGRTGARRRPLLLLGLAAAFLVGGAVVVGALGQRIAPRPTAPASNGWVAFVANGKYGDALQVAADQGRTGDRDIYVTRDGVGPRRIVGTGRDGLAQDCPAFSADGSLLVYTEVDPETIQGTPPPLPVGSDGNPQQPTPTEVVGPAQYTIVGLRVDAAGTAVPAGSITPVGELAGCAVPSPDGQRIAYATTTGDIWITSLDGARTSVDGTRDITALSWAPDGSTVAALYGQSEVWIVPVEGGEGRHLEIDRPGSAMHWSSDGTQLAVRSEGGVQILTASGTRVGGYAIPDVEGNGDLAWSPDGRIIAQVRGDKIALLTAEGKLIRLVRPAWPKTIGAVHSDSMSLRWAPDGTRLAVAVRTSGPEGSSHDPGALVSVPIADGEAVTVLIPPTLGFSGGSWDVTWQAVFE